MEFYRNRRSRTVCDCQPVFAAKLAFADERNRNIGDRNVVLRRNDGNNVDPQQYRAEQRNNQIENLTFLHCGSLLR